MEVAQRRKKTRKKRSRKKKVHERSCFWISTLSTLFFLLGEVASQIELQHTWHNQKQH